MARDGDMVPQCAVFDLDGVITDTASIHFRAWKETFELLLLELEGPSFRPFEYGADYVPYVDGKPRFDGVASFLESRSIDLPYGSPEDDPDSRTVCGVGNRKNDRFRQLAESGSIPVFGTTVALVDALNRIGVPCAVASSSRNCRFVLRSTGLEARFRTVVDGTDSAELGLAGKPAPDIFVTACARLEAAPQRSMMVEDAYSGVEAGVNGGFALVVGVARNGDVEGLLRRGADLVVADLGESPLEELLSRFRRKIT